MRPRLETSKSEEIATGNQTSIMMSVIHHHIYFLNLDHIRKVLSERLAILLQSNPPQMAYTKLNKEVKEKLPENVNKHMISVQDKLTETNLRKRKERGKKVFRLFSNVGGIEAIEWLKSFNATSILNLSPDDVDFLIARLNK
ncbi:hypothetical protein GLOIN_2v1734378 [Rhizophagus clarus]|uniref:Uncharacterized protein n=1 Tax=Rhizophagus clarus TaxID=94130 RepID=A0A8H3M709_9GLOM|nr:hypothetical protein GLOIN_2v1734378 [Rhizophagus clarus]